MQICGWEEWLKYNTSPTFIGKRFQIFEVFLLLTSSSVCFVFKPIIYYVIDWKIEVIKNNNNNVLVMKILGVT